MKIALISDSLTMDSLSAEDGVSLYNITKSNYNEILKSWKPDILFVESTWLGDNNEWRYKVASYPDYPRCSNAQLKKLLNLVKKFGIFSRSNNQLRKVVSCAKDLGIPTIFWNKEDGIHFDRFIDSAKLFDYIFTVDESCIERYRAVVDSTTRVHTLMFGVQSKFHSFTSFDILHNRASFVGSYSTHIHSQRRYWQDMMFELSSKSLGLDVYDRNSSRKSNIYRYPIIDNVNIYPAVSYAQTADIYRNYLINLNVNTIENSPTMFSRRLIEILACGRVAITNDTRAVQNYFKDYCYSFSSKEELSEMFDKFKRDGLSNDDKDRLKSAADYIVQNHTWSHRLKTIREIVGV